MLELVCKNLPASLDTKANNYSKVDRQMPIRAVSEERPKVIGDLPIIDDTGKFRFITNRVVERRQTVESDST